MLLILTISHKNKDHRSMYNLTLFGYFKNLRKFIIKKSVQNEN